MRIRVVNILGWIGFIAILCIIVYLISTFFGNPVCHSIARSTAQHYLQSNFTDNNYEIVNSGFNLKTGGYYAHVVSPTSKDSHFTIYFDGLGRYQYNTSSCIADGSNTYSRITMQYRNLVREKLPYAHFDIDIGHGELRVAGVFEIFDYTDKSGERKHYTLTQDYGMDKSTLILDAEYDILSLGRNRGSLCVNIEDETITIERTAEVLLKLKTLLDEQGLPFHAIDFTLCAPRNEDGMRSGPSIRLIEFQYSDIYEEGLIDRVQESWNITQEHYAIQDGLTNEAKLLIPFLYEIPEENP